MLEPRRFFASTSSVALGAWLVLLAPAAHAFCRSTTCTGGECVRDDDNCKVDGAKLFWPSLCVSFSMNAQASEFIDLPTARDIVQRSFVSWSDLECEGGTATLAFAPGKDSVCRAAEYNASGPNANIVLFQDHRWSYTSPDNTLAKTTVTYDTETGEIFDADIELNHAFNEFTTGDEEVVYDLQSIVTHEAGHFIGMDHTPDFLATMNAGYQQGSTELRTIETDDIDGACAAYPPTRNVQCNPEPRGGFTDTCSTDEGQAASEAAGGPEREEEGCSLTRAGTGSTRRFAWGLLATLVVALGARRQGRRH
jgi:hypothetical protein